MACPVVSHAGPLGAQPSLLESPSDKVENDDDSVLLSSNQLQRVTYFRNEIRVCKTDLDRYETCVRVRDELLSEHAGVQLLAAACEHVMFAECTEYRNRKKTPAKPVIQPTALDEDDIRHWNRFHGIAQDGLVLKSKCLTALKAVARYWGQDIVQHYQWALKGRGYCDKLCTAAHEVHEWKRAVEGLNRSMIDRSQKGMTLKRRPIQATINPIEQKDLDNLRKGLPDKASPINLPPGFGFDKFGLIVHEKFAVPASSHATNLDGFAAPVQPAPEVNISETSHVADDSPRVTDSGEKNPEGVLDDDLVNDAINHFLTPESDNESSTSRVRPNDDPLGITQEAHGSSTRVLRERLQKPSYQGTQVAGYMPKSKQLKTSAPKLPQSCCPSEVPPALLASLDHPFLFPESAEYFSPYVKKLCHSHLQRYAERTSALALAQKRDSLVAHRNKPIISPTTAMNTLDVISARRRTASLPDISQYIPSPKRQRLDGLQHPPDVYMKLDATGEAPMHDPVADEIYRRQVLIELTKKLEEITEADTHGLKTDRLILSLLQKAEPPNTDKKRGPVEALFLTGTQAAMHVESGTPDLPIFTEGQQQFKWSSRDRPIVELFRRMDDLNRSVSVQIPSRKSTSTSYASRTLNQVQARFLANKETDDPWNILDLSSPLPPSILPSFLMGENCQLLPRIRDVILNEGTAEIVVASREQWNEWRDVLEWVLLSQGGNNTAPHKDFLPAWLTAQEEPIGFGWMSLPTQQDEDEWEADPHHYTGGRWRYAVLKPGQTVFFKSITIHFVFRLRGSQTLGLGGHILQWSGIEQWLQNAIKLINKPRTTNEAITGSALQYARAVDKLVRARVKNGRAQELGGEGVAKRIFALVKELEQQCQNRRHPLPS